MQTLVFQNLYNVWKYHSDDMYYIFTIFFPLLSKYENWFMFHATK